MGGRGGRLALSVRRCDAGALLVSAALLTSAAPTANGPAQARELRGVAAVDAALAVREVAPGVYVHFGQPLALDAPGHDDIANIGFIVGERCVAVIDTGGSTRIGRALRAAVRARSRLPICYVINTHGHVDHVLGNSAFRPDGAQFVGHSQLAAALNRSRRFLVQQYAGDLDQPPTPGQIIEPGIKVQEDYDLDLGRRHLALHAWPLAHSDCDLTMLDLKTGTLWAGDLLFRGRLPAVDGSVRGWLAALDELARWRVRRTVPGHGPLTVRLAAALEPERGYLRALDSGVRAALANGSSLQQAIDQVAAEQASRWSLWSVTHPRNVARVYQQMQWQ